MALSSPPSERHTLLVRRVRTNFKTKTELKISRKELYSCRPRGLLRPRCMRSDYGTYSNGPAPGHATNLSSHINPAPRMLPSHSTHTIPRRYNISPSTLPIADDTTLPRTPPHARPLARHRRYIRSKSTRDLIRGGRHVRFQRCALPPPLPSLLDITWRLTRPHSRPSPYPLPRGWNPRMEPQRDGARGSPHVPRVRARPRPVPRAPGVPPLPPGVMLCPTNRRF